MAFLRPMLVHFGLDALRARWPESLVVIGTFDGVHLGHQEVIRRAVDAARASGLPCVLATFDRHPAAILRPGRVPPALSTLDRNLEAFAHLDVSATVVLPFNAWLSRLTAERFLDDVLRDALKASRLVVGHDFAMGSGREGTVDWLAARIPTEIVAPFEIDGHRVSSSEIRRAIAVGEMERARTLLGRSHRLEGVVVPGQRLGRTLGYPTANLALSTDLLLPPDGVYAATADLSLTRNALGQFPAALSIGVRPTVGDGLSRTIEANLLDYDGPEFYGRPMTLHVERRLRGEQKFDSLDALKSQMARDVEAIRTFGRSRM